LLSLPASVEERVEVSGGSQVAGPEQREHFDPVGWRFEEFVRLGEA